MKNLKTLEMENTLVIDLRPLQFLYKLEFISAHHSCIIDVSPLPNLTLLVFLSLKNNKITNEDSLKHHKNFSNFQFSKQNAPTTDELRFYSKILKVHSSHKQIRKILNKNNTSQSRTLLASKKNYVYVIMQNQIMAMSKVLNLLAQFIQNSYSD
ncbi:leucine-rich_repeat domain-containing protein [Hexamita inflata]|uniref:Leucine-rich repeat domain-containing protein n=1 Tax=Hexamita inflata TaxID=28002 RepID=A0AA86TKI4_9EUKA|nr:leucine-rich repeat domain-containing protein [Hexamita inflata]